LNLLSSETEGFSGAEIENLIREAVMSCLREDIQSQQLKIEFLLSSGKTSKKL